VKVAIARVAGFCMGVRRAVDMALEASNTALKPVYTYGPLIHNPSVLSLLEARGVNILREIPEHGKGTVIIRAHGVLPQEMERLRKAGFNVLDATCSRVIQVQMIVRHHARKGCQCVLIGDRGHPEVAGIMGYAQGRGILVDSEADIEDLPILTNYIIVAQTTQDRERFEVWTRRILEKYPGGKVFETICDSTRKRQAEVRRLAAEVDAMVVVGGRESANTRRLAEIVAECGKPAIAVETEEDLDPVRLAGLQKVGITAGASTPNWIINRVVRAVEALPGAGDAAIQRGLYRLVRFLHESNLWTALAGGALGLAVSRMETSALGPGATVAMTFCYIFAMHALNRLIDWQTCEFNDPLRARFLFQHKGVFYTLAVLAVCASLWIAWTGSAASFALLLALTAFGVLYTMPFLPGGGRSLKDLPGSKTVFVALAWASVAVLVPDMGWDLPQDARRGILFVLVAVLVYLRAALMEVLDVQGDRIVGRETLTVVMGEEKTTRLVQILSLTLGAVSVVFATLGSVPLAAAFCPASLWMFWLAGRFRGERLGQYLRLELMVEASFFLLLGCVFLLDRFRP